MLVSFDDEGLGLRAFLDRPFLVGTRSGKLDSPEIAMSAIVKGFDFDFDFEKEI